MGLIMNNIEKIQELAKEFFSTENLENVLKNVELPELQDPDNFLYAKLFLCALSRSNRLFYSYEPPRTESYNDRIKEIKRIKKQLNY